MQTEKKKIYEYQNPSELGFDERDFVPIPYSFITADFSGIEPDGFERVDVRKLHLKFIPLYIFLYLHAGLGNRLTFTISDIAYFLKQKVDRQKGGFNQKIWLALDSYDDIGGWEEIPQFYNESKHDSKFHRSMTKEPYCKILSKSDSKDTATTRINVFFNKDRVLWTCQRERFAILYRDEIEKIINCDFSNRDVLMLVFAYLRAKIYRRKNELEASYDGNFARRQNAFPEVYDAYYNDIANEIGLSDYHIKTSVDKLVDLGLLYTEELPRKQYRGADGKDHWSTGHTLFCNTYKREQTLLLATGIDYYMPEIARKKAKLSFFETNCQTGDNELKTGFHTSSPIHAEIIRNPTRATAKPAKKQTKITTA